jgi:alkylation response protein AidB-like acyl-CoA dehydrogenase
MPKFVKGEAFIGICSTEPIGGSDVASFTRRENIQRCSKKIL